MSVTITKDKYPTLANGTGISGKRVVLYLNYGASATVENPVWIQVGGCSNHNLTISAEVSSAQMKENGYWASGAIVSKSAELTAEVYVLRDSEAQLAIEEFVMDDDITAEKGALQFAIVDLDTKEYVVVNACPSSWECPADSEDLLKKSLTATVVGAPEKKTGFTAA